MVRPFTEHPCVSSTMSLALLEQQLQRKLRDPWRVRRRDRAEALESPRIWTDLLCIGDVSVGQAKLSVIEGVEQFRPELQIHSFLDEGVFQQSDIPVVDSRPAEEPSPRVAQSSQGFWTEQGCIEIWRCRRAGITDMERPFCESRRINRQRDGPGAGGTQKRIVVRFNQRNGKSSRKPGDAAQPPALHQPARTTQAIKRQLVVVTDYEVVSSVE